MLKQRGGGDRRKIRKHLFSFQSIRDHKLGRQIALAVRKKLVPLL